MVSKEKIFRQMASIIASAHQLHYEMTKDIPMDDITPLQYEILEFLSVKQPLTLSQISECKGISMPNTSREIRKLVEKGLCEKIGDAEDRRKLFIRLSASGESRMAAAFAHMSKLFMHRIEGISEVELSKISEAIGLLEATVFRSDN